MALDFESAARALALVDTIGDTVRFYKIGLELFTATGPSIVKEVLARGNKVFLDLKFHDIPETVKRATASASELGVHFLTVHAHPQVMQAAIAGRSGDAKILAVTVLTSVDEAELPGLGYGPETTVLSLVQQRVDLGIAIGVDGFVCSPLEVGPVRLRTGAPKKLVVPGVRSAGKKQGDQKRVATPRQAYADGASYLVIGRQITRAAEPKAEAAAILDEIFST